jgi:hypothetical protein
MDESIAAIVAAIGTGVGPGQKRRSFINGSLSISMNLIYPKMRCFSMETFFEQGFGTAK